MRNAYGYHRGPPSPLRPSDEAGHRVRIGRFGERLAADYLTRRGMTILGRNVRAGRGEIDIHGLLGGVPVAVEVRTIVAASDQEEAVTRFTRDKAGTVRRYAARLDPPARRVDLVAVTIRPGAIEVRWLPYAA